ncbi:ATP-binding protein [Streptomyces sp. NBC_01003]|uniref:ATP-binding protein n=1 Tax=Streptomyces sp. NBC_01003 TaxID=2903714 RepID=UPI003870DEAB|nr:ATP-binding protein [Streptomyces sp. NBC_01003]
MGGCRCEVERKSWELAFLAEPEEVAGIRNITRIHLEAWGLPDQIEAAQLCVSELTANVITHVGPGTPTTLAVSMNGTYLRIEVHDPDARALPTLLSSDADAESGRGMALVDAFADRWGVVPRADSKITWCELATDLSAPKGHAGGLRVTRAESLIALYGEAGVPREAPRTRLGIALAEETVIDVITDLLHWLRAHGRDPDEVLDRAQGHFDPEVLGGGSNRVTRDLHCAPLQQVGGDFVDDLGGMLGVMNEE